MKSEKPVLPDRTLPIVGSSFTMERADLADALKTQIDRKFGGNLSRAAEFAKVSQPTLYRYAHPGPGANAQLAASGEGRRMSANVANRLATLLPRNERWKLFRSPEGAYGLFLYFQWLGVVIDRSGLVGVPHEKRARRESPEGPWLGRASEFNVLLGRVRDEVPTVKDQIAKTALRLTKVDRKTRYALSALGISIKEVPQTARKRKKSRSVMPKNAITPTRFLLALYRMFEPLLDSAASGWIEFRATELAKPQFRQFAVASWKREALLLSRHNDIRRTDRLRLGLRENDRRILRLRLPAK